MKSGQKRGILLPLLSIVVVALAAGGCYHATIPLTRDLYQPQKMEQFADYKDRPVSFDYDTGVQNDANDTSIFYYYNKDASVRYESTPTVAVYFFNTFTKALRAAGLRVYDASPPPDAPALHIVLKSVSDIRVTFTTTLVKQGRELLNKTYAVDIAPTTEENPEALAKRAYETVDKMVATMLNDEEFKKVILAKN